MDRIAIKRSIALLICICAVFLMAGCKMRESRIDYVIGVSLANLTEQWRLVLKEEIETEAANYDNIQLIFTDAANDSGKQMADVEKLMSYGIDLLIISPSDVEKMTPMVSQVYADIPVIVLDRAIEGLDYSLFIGPDNELIGEQAGQQVKELLDQSKEGETKVLELMTNSYACQKRSETFAETVSDVPVKMEKMLLSEGTRDCAEDMLLANPEILEDVDVIFAHNDYVAYGARLAAAKAGYEEVWIVGLDGFEGDNSGLQMVQDGIIDATVTCPTGGREAVKNAVDILNQVSGMPKQIILRSGIVNSENIDQYMSKEEIKKPSVTKTIHVGCIQAGDEGGWREANQDSIKDAAREFGIDLSLIITEQSLEEQIQQVRTCIAQDMDVIVLTPVVEDGWEEVLTEAKEAGIPVLLSDRKMGVSVDMYTAYIGAEFVEQGRRCAAWLLENKEELDNVDILEIQGTKGASPTTERKQGFEDGIAEDSRCRIVYSAYGDYNREGGRRVVQEYLNTHEWDIEVIYAHNDDMALGAIEVLRENDIVPGKDVKIISIDGTKDALKALERGEINCVAECNPLLGTQLMKAITDLMNGHELPLRIITDEMVFTAETSDKLLKNRKY